MTSLGGASRFVRKTIPSAVLLLLAPAVALTSSLIAQATPPVRVAPAADTLSATDLRSIHSLAPIGVVARRARVGYGRDAAGARESTPMLHRDAAQTVAVVGRALIDDRAMQGLADVLQFIPGARMGQGEGNRDQSTIRGNNSTSNFFVDGLRDDVQYVRDLYNVERVEGLFGANALSFGRGVGGGVINRVTKSALQRPVGEARASAGSFGGRRGAIDFGRPVSPAAAVRVNAMYENSDLFRRGATVERYGLNPTVAVTRGDATRVTAGVEYFHDDRTADRGIPSFGGGPVPVDPATFFGNPESSTVAARVTAADAAVEHRVSDAVTLTSRVRYADYDKFYQNVYPGAVTSGGTTVRILAYNEATERRNLLTQTEIVTRVAAGGIRHTLLAGVALGRQVTDIVRNTGYFSGTDASVEVPVADPVARASISFRPGASDADNHVDVGTASVYVEDQATIGDRVHLFGGLRVERFAIDVRKNRSGATLRRVDAMVSPRGGVAVDVMRRVSVFASAGVTALPGAGDQFTSLDTATATLEPETFTNYEAGLKWVVADRIELTASAYLLDRNHARAPDPLDPTRTVQTGSQRSRGIELGVQGTPSRGWQVAAGYALQHAVITGRTSTAALGAFVPLVPRHSASVWNRVRVFGGVEIGVGGIYQGASFAAFDNTVTLPSFTRIDAAAFLRVSANVDAQANVENLFDTRYFLTSHNNNNITPGSPRAIRVSLVTRF